MGGLNLREVRWDEFRALAPGMLLGGLVGLWLAGQVTSARPLLLLGAYIAGVGLRALRVRREEDQGAHTTALTPASRRSAWVCGTGIGLVVMLFATGGPLVLTWLTRRGLGARAMRSSLPVIIMLAALMALDGRLFSAVLGQRLLVLLPIALAGVLVGHRVAHRFRPSGCDW